MKDGQLYRVKVIKTEADYPKVKGEYITQFGFLDFNPPFEWIFDDIILEEALKLNDHKYDINLINIDNVIYNIVRKNNIIGIYE